MRNLIEISRVVFRTGIFCFLLFSTLLTKATSIDSFPESWIGEWKGTLEIYGNEGKQMEIPMELHILPIENSPNFTWNIIYGEDKETGLRAYELVSMDRVKGHYLIDEKNSIKIDNFYLAGKLKSLFEVKGSIIVMSIEKVGNKLEYEIVAGKSDDLKITGDSIIGGQEIPPVSSYPFTGMQKASLSRL